MTTITAEVQAAPVERRPALDWRVFAVLLILNFIASVLLVPYAFSLQQSSGTELFPGAAGMSSVEQQGILAAGQVISTLCINLPLLAAGLFIAPRLNLGAPVLDRLLHGRPLDVHLRRGLGIGLGLGLISGTLLIGLAYLVEPVVNAELAAYNITLPENINPPAWSGFLASISAAITEETMLRLFGLSLVAWIGRALLDRRGGVPSLPVLWGANVLVALVFGALHFPNMMMFGALTPLVMVQILLMNGLIGVLFGWLYWKYGLESAMVAHFSVDIVLHVLAVFLPA